MPNQQFIDDQTLVNLYIKGDESALETLLLRHKTKNLQLHHAYDER
jgi:hypothetical protein